MFHQISDQTAIIHTKEGIGGNITMWLKKGSELDAIDRELGPALLELFRTRALGAYKTSVHIERKAIN